MTNLFINFFIYYICPYNSHVQELRPHVIVTYNGDFFDWPYVDKRCSKYGLSLYKNLGIRLISGNIILFYFVF